MSDESLPAVPAQPETGTNTQPGTPGTGEPGGRPRLSGRGPRPRSSRRPALQKPQPTSETTFTPEQRLLILDACSI